MSLPDLIGLFLDKGFSKSCVFGSLLQVAEHLFSECGALYRILLKFAFDFFKITQITKHVFLLLSNFVTEDFD